MMMMLMMMMMLLMMTVTINMYIYIYIYMHPPLRYPRFVLESCKIVVVSLQTFPIATSILGHL